TSPCSSVSRLTSRRSSLFTYTTLFRSFEKRGRVMGIVGMVISAAPALGPTVGGIILEQLVWRWMFWTVLPIAVVTLLIGGSLLRDRKSTRLISSHVSTSYAVYCFQKTK